MAAEVKSDLSVRKLPRVVIKHLLSLSFVQIDQPTRVKRPITKVDGKVDILNDTKKSKIETPGDESCEIVKVLISDRNMNEKADALNAESKSGVDNNGSDSEDDIPIAELMKRRAQALKSLSQPASAKTEVKVKSAATTKSAKSQSASKSSTDVKKEKSPAMQSVASNRGATKSGDFYFGTKKGYLVQTLLVRWWYALTWPTEEDIGTPPIGYESLDGFPGVYVNTTVSYTMIF